MDWSIIITPVVTVLCTALGSLVTWLLSRKKYKTEVEHNSIENMEGSLEFYEKLTASSNKILAEVLEKSEKLAQSNVELLIEVQNLRAQIGILTEVLKNELDAVDFEKYGIKINEDGTLIRF
jgi:hypothetical protein